MKFIGHESNAPTKVRIENYLSQLEEKPFHISSKEGEKVFEGVLTGVYEYVGRVDNPHLSLQDGIFVKITWEDINGSVFQEELILQPMDI